MILVSVEEIGMNPRWGWSFDPIHARADRMKFARAPCVEIGADENRRIMRRKFVVELSHIPAVQRESSCVYRGTVAGAMMGSEGIHVELIYRSAPWSLITAACCERLIHDKRFRTLDPVQ